jgi:hypothetical protein
VCDPQSGGCVPAPDPPLSTPCEADGNACTVDHCDGNGSCVFLAPGQGQNCGGHFKCYKTRASPFQSRVVTLVDQFGPSTATVVRTTRFCNPADKAGEGIPDPTAHLNCYKIRDSATARPKVVVENQFGSQTLEVRRPDSLCTPAEKDGVPINSDLNHYKCYRVVEPRDLPRFTERTVTVDDQFEEKVTRVIRPFYLCNPVDKNGEGVPDPTAHLTCYKIADAPGQPAFVPQPADVSDQFTRADLLPSRRTDCGRSRLLCVPSSKRIASPSGAFLTLTPDLLD